MSRWVEFRPEQIKLLPSVPGIYALYQHHALVYIGRTVNLRSRFGVQRYTWFTTAKARCETRENLPRAEVRLISRLRPIRNIQHTGRRYAYIADHIRQGGGW